MSAEPRSATSILGTPPPTAGDTAAPETTAATTGAGASFGHHITERPVVLIVDDRPENLLALEAVLEPLGLEVVRADSGEAALRRLLAPDGAEVSLIVLDVQMPGMDGFETAAHIKSRERTRHIPIIFLTAISTELTHALRGYETGAVDYVAKPFEPEVLRAKVRVLIELRQHARTIEAQRVLLAQRLDERDRAQEALARQTIELERSNAELERFARALSTELHGPVHLAAGFLDLLADQHHDELSADARLLLDKAISATERLSMGIEHLLAYATVSTEVRTDEVVPLDELVDDVRGALHRDLMAQEANLSSDPLPEVVGDRWQLSRVLMHLIDNALRHTGQGVDIHVGLSRRDGDWVLSVRDDGPGIPPDLIPGLFTVLDATRPHGVGLPIASRIVERHGGTMWADSQLGQGTTISFTLPVPRDTPTP
jgi:two-component system, sensor histidine kinase and response regulator